jgi:hypothetical protein
VAQYFEEKAESRPSIRPAPVRSLYKGVYPVTQRTPTGLKTLWSAEVFEKYDRVVLGVFSSEEEARTVYEERMKELDPSTSATPSEDEKVLRRVVLRERADAERKLTALSARKSVNTEKTVTEKDGKSATESATKTVTETVTQKGKEELETAVKKEEGDEEKKNGDSTDHSAAAATDPIAHVKADASVGEMKEGMEERKEDKAEIVSEKEEIKEETSKEEKVKEEGAADSVTPKEGEEGEEEEEEADDHSMDSQDSDSLLATSEEDDDEVRVELDMNITKITWSPNCVS